MMITVGSPALRGRRDVLLARLRLWYPRESRSVWPRWVRFRRMLIFLVFHLGGVRPATRATRVSPTLTAQRRAILTFSRNHTSFGERNRGFRRRGDPSIGGRSCFVYPGFLTLLARGVECTRRRR